jgi:predicted amidohydrolase
MKFKIAVVQFEITQLQPEKNLKKAEAFIKRAKRKGADIIVFPEDFVTGITRGKKQFIDFKGKYRKHFQGLAKKYRIHMIAGSIIEGSKKGRFNVLHYIDASGKCRASYSKINLWLTERDYLKPGHGTPVVKTRFGRIGFGICWDLNFPEPFRQMARKGAEVVFLPAHWGYEDAGPGLKHDRNSEAKFIDAQCTARAFENGIIFVFCNAAGKARIGNLTETLVGHSQITVPFKGPLRKLEHNREAMFVQTVDTAILKDAEKAYLTRHDLKRFIKP